METRRFLLAPSMMFLLLFQIISMAVPAYAAADLVVESISLSNPNPSVGQKVKIIFTVKNAGDAKSQPFHTTVHIDGSFFYEQSSGDTHEGNTVTESTKFWEYNGGSHIITVCTDSRNTNAEPNESNCKSISVGGPTPKVATTIDISVCPASGSGYDCTASLTAGSNTQVRIEGMLKRSDTQEGLSSRLVQLSWPGGATVVTTSSTGGYSYTTSVTFSSSATFVASFGGDSGYESSSNSRTVGVSSPPLPPPPPPTPSATETCNNGIDDDGDGYVDEGCPVTPPPQADVSIRLRSDAEDGSKDIGKIIFDGSYYSLPTTIYKKPGSYSIQAVPDSGYVFKQWDVGTPAASRSSPSTSVTVSGSSVIVEMDLRTEPVIGTFHFSMSASPDYKSIKAGDAATFSIPVTLTSGPSQPVSLSVSGLPSSVGTASLSQIYGNPSFTPVLTVSTHSSANPGNYYVTVSGSGGGENQSTRIMVEVLSSGSQVVTPQTDPYEEPTRPESVTGLGTFSVAKGQYQLNRHTNTEVKFSGEIYDYNRGKPIELTIRKPGESPQILTTYGTKDGMIMTSLILDKNSPTGTYAVEARYDGSLVGSVSFYVSATEEAVIIQAPFDFSINLSKSSLELKKDTSVDLTINTITTSGNNEIVSLSCASSKNIICEIDPKNVRSSQSSIVKITAKEQGESTVTIIGTYLSQVGSMVKRDTKLQINVISDSSEPQETDASNAKLYVDHSSFLTWPSYLGGNKIVASIDYRNDMNTDVKFQLVLEDFSGKKSTYSSHPLFGESIAKAGTNGKMHFLSDELPRNSVSMKVYWQAFSYSDNKLGKLLDQSAESEKIPFYTFSGKGEIIMTVEQHGTVSKKEFDFNNDNGFFAYKYPVNPREANSLTVNYRDDVPFVIAPLFAPSTNQNVNIFVPDSIQVIDYSTSGAEIIEIYSTNHHSLSGKWYKLKIPARACESKTCTTLSGGISFDIENPDGGPVSILIQTADFGDVIANNILDQIVSSMWNYWASKMTSGSWIGPEDAALFAASVTVDYLNSRQILILDAGSVTKSQQPSQESKSLTSPSVSDVPRPSGVSQLELKINPASAYPTKTNTIIVTGYYNPGIGGGLSYPKMQVTGVLWEKDGLWSDDEAGTCESGPYQIEAHPSIGFPQDTGFECKFSVIPSDYTKEWFEGKDTEWFAKIRVTVDGGFDKSFETKTITINCPTCS